MWTERRLNREKERRTGEGGGYEEEEMLKMTYLLTYGAEPFLRSCQLCSHSGTSQYFKEP
jgi:hypothetical protein